ncbi:MAG: CBS domain-containing protein [Desulfobulbaceae bacterium]|nr:CBS domain-containing protein [Desulfobulbaceae bacterium]HIJ78800.1 CBS domain-containing protein [Deltaproteobacteria bacterium]
MLTAKDMMAKEVITVKPDLPVEKLAAILWGHRINGVPVVDESGTMIGVVTEGDLVDQKKKFHIPTAIAILDSVIFLDSAKSVEKEINKMTGATVGDICSKKPITIALDTPLDEIATIMSEHKVHTLPVLKNGSLVGVVGKADIIRTLAKEK